MTGCSQGTVREGARGGRAEFSWDQVRTDEHRENYLGHSILAPTGRWQKGRDITWYNKNEQKDSDEAQTSALEARRKELLSIKQKEEEEMNRRLGKKVDVPGIPVIGSALLHGSDKKATDDLDRLETGVSKDDRRAARKLAKQQVREQRRDEHRRRKEERRRDRERSYFRRSVSDDDRHSRSPSRRRRHASHPDAERDFVREDRRRRQEYSKDSGHSRDSHRYDGQSRRAEGLGNETIPRIPAEESRRQYRHDDYHPSSRWSPRSDRYGQSDSHDRDNSRRTRGQYE